MNAGPDWCDLPGRAQRCFATGVSYFSEILSVFPWEAYKDFIVPTVFASYSLGTPYRPVDWSVTADNDGSSAALFGFDIICADVTS